MKYPWFRNIQWLKDTFWLALMNAGLEFCEGASDQRFSTISTGRYNLAMTDILNWTTDRQEIGS